MAGVCDNRGVVVKSTLLAEGIGPPVSSLLVGLWMLVSEVCMGWWACQDVVEWVRGDLLM